MYCVTKLPRFLIWPNAKERSKDRSPRFFASLFLIIFLFILVLLCFFTSAAKTARKNWILSCTATATTDTKGAAATTARWLQVNDDFSILSSTSIMCSFVHYYESRPLGFYYIYLYLFIITYETHIQSLFLFRPNHWCGKLRKLLTTYSQIYLHWWSTIFVLRFTRQSLYI